MNTVIYAWCLKNNPDFNDENEIVIFDLKKSTWLFFLKKNFSLL